MIKIGIIREGKVPPDARVPFTPLQCVEMIKEHDVKVVVQPSDKRCFKDEEYRNAGITLTEDLDDCDVLMGIKEVPKSMLIPEKKYCFFSHTHKKQAYNRPLLQKILEKKIHLMDYEVMTDELNLRLIAFGYYAGMVGAHNAMWTYSQRTESFEMKRLKDCFDYAEARESYRSIDFPAVKIVLTGTGRVGMGARQVLLDMGIEQVTPDDFLEKEYDHAVFAQLTCSYYAQHKDGGDFDKEDYFVHPQDYVSIFEPFTKVADVMINGIYWDSKAPKFFTVEDMAKSDFKIKVIADVTCDIAPSSSIPSTLRASTIADPLFGFDPLTGAEVAPHQEGVIDMMTIDNLPSEIPRDSSEAFGRQFIDKILPEFLKEQSDVLERASIAIDGHLGSHFQYLEDFVKEKA